MRAIADAFRGVTIGWLADVASLIGLALTIFVAVSVRRIKNFYVLRARVPDLMKQVGEAASELARLQPQAGASHQEIDLVFVKIEVLLKSLRKKVGRNFRTSIDQVSGGMAGYQKTRNAETLWPVYVSIQKLSAELSEHEQDLTWDR